MATNSNDATSLKIRSSQVLHSEAYETLLARAHRRTGAVPAEAIVRHVLTVTRGGDWPVQRDALEAVLRRCASAHADEIQIVARPRRLSGLYETRRRGSRARPYRTLLRRIEPIEGSCECADFLRGCLGLCKHLIAVLEDARRTRRRIEKEPPSAAETPPLRWDPVRPLTGHGDWLARVRWVGGTPNPGLRVWMRRTTGDGWTFKVPEASPQRRALVERLLAVVKDSSGDPALHALLEQERVRLAREIQGARARQPLGRALSTLKQSLYPYQRDGVERFFVRGRLLIADDMGLGKTAQAMPPAMLSGAPARSAVDSSSSPRRSSRSGFANGSSSPTRLRTSSKACPHNGGPYSRPAVMGF